MKRKTGNIIGGMFLGIAGLSVAAGLAYTLPRNTQMGAEELVRERIKNTNRIEELAGNFGNVNEVSDCNGENWTIKSGLMPRLSLVSDDKAFNVYGNKGFPGDYVNKETGVAYKNGPMSSPSVDEIALHGWNAYPGATRFGQQDYDKTVRCILEANQ